MIKDIYRQNLDEAFEEIALILDDYPIIAVDTEFPGVFDDPEELRKRLGPIDIRSTTYHGYRKLKLNIDNMKLIQLGLTFCDEQGRMPTPIHTWQFHFKFDVQRDIHQHTAIQLLTKHLLPFHRLIREGIPHLDFSTRLITSGIVFNPRVQWVCFHGAYDFGYLVKVVINQALPGTRDKFQAVMRDIFPGHVWDVKVINRWGSSLSSLASELGVKREGETHQAGSDAMVTMAVWRHLLARDPSSAQTSRSHVLFGLSEGWS
eukprot:gnl/Dysnectes_brevis/839_a926_4458.p1 GENE.gnl/Dysnectes_brevis/839_a926_4458~~gnl/Dysnectes_brevis/839_a926_4458.p1  ORF type:complete len:261 (+),score=32.23 gnl/Dysnectes_brevis/839_a926_4458:36-818(+)